MYGTGRCNLVFVSSLDNYKSIFMKIIATSDLHGNLPQIPPCDLLLIAGDICPLTSHDLYYQYGWLDTNFRFWLNRVPAKRVIMTFGNHDFISQRQQNDVIELELKADMLFNESIIVDGVKIWGSPYSHFFHDWAWNAYEDELLEMYQKIPNDTDIIITHGPPKYFGDRTLTGLNVGSESLLETLKRFSKKILICGHIHEGYGKYEDNNQNIIYNVSLVNRKYQAVNPLVEILLDK